MLGFHLIHLLSQTALLHLLNSSSIGSTRVNKLPVCSPSPPILAIPFRRRSSICQESLQRQHLVRVEPFNQCVVSWLLENVNLAIWCVRNLQV